ncbi:MAG TPA: hypothetical protein VIL15_00925 [Coriobacteriia bacterium]
MDTQAHSAPNAAPVFLECAECGYLSSGPAFAGDARCPLCGRVGDDKRAFPPDRQRRLDERIRAYHADAEWEIVVILGAALLEALLEDILDRIMAAHGADVAVRGTVLDNVRAIGTRIGRLFPQLTGTEFEDAAGKLGYRDFPKRWRELRSQRNAFIHDTPYRDFTEGLDKDVAAETIRLLDQAYELFVSLNNEFVADALKGRKRATDLTPTPHPGTTDDDPQGAVAP